MIFGVHVSSATVEQLTSLYAFIESNKENTFYIYTESNVNQLGIKEIPESIILEDKDAFCVKLIDCDNFLYIGESDLIQDEKIVNNFLAAKVKKIYFLDKSGQLHEKRNSQEKGDMLFIFPGSILPLNLGSHQRAFNLINRLKEVGIKVDLLITAPKKMDIGVLGHTLSYFCNNIYFYENEKKVFPTMLKAKRFAEKHIKKISNKNSNLPDLFSERLITKPNNSCKKWVNSLYLNNNYKYILVSYAWMLPSIDLIEHDRKNFHLICDTHDVQFIRNKNLFERNERLLVNENYEKDLEINSLNACDSVLAISVSDEKFLKPILKPKVNLLKAAAGFNYALLPIKSRPLRQPFRFGFIGGKMDANVQSLEFIIDNWWPKIKEFSPESKFYIAGSICSHPTIFNKVFLDENIVRLGFVDSLIDFYNGIDVSLNPVLVQGGLNFKSVEAVFAGKHLATNSLGAECLGTDFPAIIVDNAEDLIKYLSNLEFDYKLDKEIRKKNQDKVVELFGNKILSTTLINRLFNYL